MSTSTSTTPTSRKKLLKSPLASESLVTKLLNNTRERPNVLGDLCKFELRGLEIDPATLYGLLSKHGFQDWRPVDIRPKTAARKAITRIRPMLEDPKNDLRVLVRPVPTAEKDVVRYAIVDEHTDVTRVDLDFSTRNQVIFRMDTGTLEFTGAPVQEIIDEFEYLCGVYTDSEIRLMVDNIVTKNGALDMHDNTGMFFMGHPVKHIVDSLVGLFSDFRGLANPPKLAYFRPIAIVDDEANRMTMGNALIADIQAELTQAKELMDGAVKENGKVRKGSVKRALERFSEVQGKAKLYKDMLQINMDAITAEITQAQAQAGEFIKVVATSEVTD